MAGFYGKLPARGDFLARGLPREFTDQWDDWLQVGMNDSRDSLGDDWLQTYLTSPIWRFVLPENTVSKEAWAGVLMPSVDKVGRYFPMMVAAQPAASSMPLLVAAFCTSWFDTIEAQLLAALDTEELDIDQFASAVQAVDMPAPEIGRPPAPAVAATDHGVRMALPEDTSLAQLFLQQSMAVMEPLQESCCIWWSKGSDLVSPSFLMSRGLPGRGKFTAFLDGNWTNRGWSESGGVASGITPTVIDVASL